MKKKLEISLNENSKLQDFSKNIAILEGENGKLKEEINRLTQEIDQLKREVRISEVNNKEKE